MIVRCQSWEPLSRSQPAQELYVYVGRLCTAPLTWSPCQWCPWRSHEGQFLKGQSDLAKVKCSRLVTAFWNPHLPTPLAGRFFPWLRVWFLLQIVSNEESRAPPQTSWIRICLLPRSPDTSGHIKGALLITNVQLRRVWATLYTCSSAWSVFARSKWSVPTFWLTDKSVVCMRPKPPECC